jgi:hypothetical protein
MADSRIYCTRCLRFGHIKTKCYKQNDANGNEIEDSNSDESEIDELEDDSDEDQLEGR